MIVKFHAAGSFPFVVVVVCLFCFCCFFVCVLFGVYAISAEEGWKC